MNRRHRLLMLAAVAGGWMIAASGAGTPVVVFCERGFPYFAANQAVSPRIVAETLCEMGLEASLASSRELAAGALRAPDVKCLVWCYGNTFPREVLEAVTEYRRSGRCTVATGVPFTHPCVRGETGGIAVWRDEGHEDFGQHERVGIGQAGGFVPREKAVLGQAEGAPFSLVSMRQSTNVYAISVPAGMGGFFYLGLQGLPPQDELVGIVSLSDPSGLRGYPVAALKHHCERFRGAVDVWAGTQWLSDPRDPAEILLARQLLLRSTLYALEVSGSLDPARARQVHGKLQQWIDDHALPARRPVVFHSKEGKRLFPGSPAVRPNDTVVVHSVERDDQATRVALGCLQGLVNRRRPRLYLVYTDHDERWLKWYEERGYVGRVERLNEVDAVVARFRSAAKGAIFVEERFLNLGTMLAGVRRGLVCTPELAGRWRLPVIADLRGRWRRDADAYRWSFRNLWPEMSHEVLCCGHHKRSPQQIDYLVAHRIFTFYISGGVDGADEGKDPAEETRFAEELFAAAAANAPVMGWWGWGEPVEGIGEYWGMTLASRYAKLTIGTEFMTNMSFHSAVPAPESFHQMQVDRLPSVPLDRAKVYVAIGVLDSGNDPWYWLRCQRDVWEAPGRGETPTGWIVGPLLLDLAPGIVEWYYHHLTNADELICALCGVGYMNVPDYGTASNNRDAVLDGYLKLTRKHMARLDLRALQTYHGSWGERSDFSRDGDLSRFARSLPHLAALFPDVGRHESTTYADANYLLPARQGEGSVPVFHCLTRWIPWGYSPDLSSRPEAREIAALVDEVRRMTPQQRPAFMSVFALSWTFRPEMINRAAKELGNPYVFVTPSQLAALFRKHTLSR